MPRYRLAGSCNGCGKCCETPSIQVDRVTFGLRSVSALVVGWHRVVNGFELIEKDPRLRLFVFRCTHYDATSRTCDSYESRPLMCRDYPVNLTWEAVPTLFPECSHRIVDRNAAQLKASLKAAGVDPTTMAQIEEKLFLKED
jgi:Fe-S-cluster containining protein